MPILVVVNDPKEWPLAIEGIELVPAKTYLTDPAYAKLSRTKIFNLCRSYRYQAIGYYVSLLAEARGHKPMPDIATIQDIKSQTIIRLASGDLDELDPEKPRTDQIRAIRAQHLFRPQPGQTSRRTLPEIVQDLSGPLSAGQFCQTLEDRALADGQHQRHCCQRNPARTP